MIQSGKFTRPEIKKDDREKYTGTKICNWLYNFPQVFFRCNATRICICKVVKMGMTVDPKEIDNKVATGPKKPGTGKTNSYSLKTNKGMLQIQVYNTGSGAKPFELNMYSS